MLGVGQILHQRYRIVRPLGHGGMGAVYEAIDERFGGPIALKEIVFASSSPQQKELVARAFEREAKSLAKAHHEAIPYVRDYFTELDRQFLVMELIEGDDLADMLIRRQAPFPLIDGLKWMDQLLDALDYLHTLDPPIIHRDIKPQNLKLNRRGRIKLLDFGIAKSSETGGPTLSNQTFVGATLDYSPIEQILRAIEPTFREYILLRHADKANAVLRQTTDARCDLYSLGATFYHLLTGHPPPDAVKRTLEIWEERQDPLANPSNLNPAIPPEISRCIMAAMSVERDSRYTSALEMQTALHAAASENRSLAGRVYNDSWKDARALREGIGEDQLRQEHELMHAETMRLDTAEAARLTGGDHELQGLPTEPMVSGRRSAPVTDEYIDPSPTPQYVTEPSVEIGETEAVPSGPASEDRKTEAFRTPSVATPAPIQPKMRSRTALWLAALVVFGLFILAATGAAILVVNSGVGSSQNSRSNVNAVSPTGSPTPFPTPTGKSDDGVSFVDPTPTPTPTPLPTPHRTPAATPEPTPVRTVEPTPRPTPVRTPVSTPTPRRTPVPKKTPDPNCVYTNTCKS